MSAESTKTSIRLLLFSRVTAYDLSNICEACVSVASAHTAHSVTMNRVKRTAAFFSLIRQQMAVPASSKRQHVNWLLAGNASKDSFPTCNYDLSM